MGKKTCSILSSVNCNNSTFLLCCLEKITYRFMLVFESVAGCTFLHFIMIMYEPLRFLLINIPSFMVEDQRRDMWAGVNSSSRQVFVRTFFMDFLNEFVDLMNWSVLISLNVFINNGKKLNSYKRFYLWWWRCICSMFQCFTTSFDIIYLCFAWVLKNIFGSLFAYRSRYVVRIEILFFFWKFNIFPNK